MRTWSIANGRADGEWCGCCGATVLNGQPMQRISLPGVPDRKRCAKCAKGPIDWDQIDAERQARLEREQPRPQTMERLGFAARRVLPELFDPKLAAAGEGGE